MKTIKEGTLKRIHVNGALLRSGAKAKQPLVILYRDGRLNKVVNASEILGEGPWKVVYRPERPNKLGAVVWIETRGFLGYR